MNVSYGPFGYEQEGAWQTGRSRIELGPVTVERQFQPVDLFSAQGNLRDRLGSTVALALNGTLKSTREYDAFGAVRAGNQGDSKGVLDLWPDTLRGFTGHEHVDAVQLIHMNGRMYDPALGRFLSVDPVIQFPSNSQSLNPYSYILNNPLSGRDPSGYAVCRTTDNSSCLLGDGGVNTVVDGSGKTVSTVIATNKGAGLNFSFSNGGSLAATFTGKSGEITRVLGGPPSEIGSISKRTNGTLEGTAATYALAPDKQFTSVDLFAQHLQEQRVAEWNAYREWTFAHEGLEQVGFAGFDNFAIDAAHLGQTIQQNGFVSSAAAIGLLGVAIDAATFGKGGAVTESLGKSLVDDAVAKLRRPYIRRGVRADVEGIAPRAADGRFIDPNTLLPIEGKYDLGHKAGNEFRREEARARADGLTQKEFNERMNDPRHYQIEDPSSNRSRRYEQKD